MEKEPKITRIKKEETLFSERLKLARDIFIQRYEALLNDPGYQPVDKKEMENLKILKSGGKIEPYRIAIDMAARVCQEKGVWSFTLKEVAAVYDELFVGWRQSEWVNYEPEEWEQNP